MIDVYMSERGIKGIYVCGGKEREECKGIYVWGGEERGFVSWYLCCMGQFESKSMIFRSFILIWIM